jgi:hypothetical protein
VGNTLQQQVRGRVLERGREGEREREREIIEMKKAPLLRRVALKTLQN